jgi:hypothetical protein
MVMDWHLLVLQRGIQHPGLSRSSLVASVALAPSTLLRPHVQSCDSGVGKGGRDIRGDVHVQCGRGWVCVRVSEDEQNTLT